MTEPQLAIYDSDKIYLSRLSDYISKNSKIRNISIYSEESKFLDLVSSDNDNLFCISSDELRDKLDYIRIKIELEVAYLTEIETDGNDNSSSSSKNDIYKYQSADEILNKLAKIMPRIEPLITMTTNYAVIDNSTDKNSKRSVIYGIYSPISKVCKSSLCVALGELLAETETTLLINLEGYSGMFKREKRKSCYSVINFIYDLVANEERCQMKLIRNVIVKNRLNYLIPASLMELLEVQLDVWNHFIGFISTKTDYSNIILDLGDCVSGLFSILKQCDIVYVPYRVNGDHISMKKLEEFLEQVGADGMNKSTEFNIKTVKIPAINSMHDEQDSDVLVRVMKDIIKREGLLLT